MNQVWYSHPGLISAGRAVNRRVHFAANQILSLALAITVMPILLILVIVVAVAIKLDSPGPVFFVQERIGRGGKRFRMYKFRTLAADHDPRLDHAFMQDYISGKTSATNAPTRPRYKPSSHGTITLLGNLLRKTSLDEAPQIFNVLRGEMSLIGPRPNVPWEVERYQLWHKERLNVRPGITGLAQVKGRSNLCFDDLVRYDIHYVRNQSLNLDLRILWWTVLTVLTEDGAG